MFPLPSSASHWLSCGSVSLAVLSLPPTDTSRSPWEPGVASPGALVLVLPSRTVGRSLPWKARGAALPCALQAQARPVRAETLTRGSLAPVSQESSLVQEQTYRG